MKMAKIRFTVCFMAVLVCSSAYAQKQITMLTENVMLTLQSDPVGAKVYMDNQLICISTPATVSIPCKGIIFKGKKKDEYQNLRRSENANAIKLVFVKEGFEPNEVIVRPNITPTKKGYDFAWPNTIIQELKPVPVIKSSDPTIPVGEETKQVSRENAGQTELEKTIIRWNFDSDPQGARVTWRVISSIPAEVKNTNETFLGTTPYEETRSFNIQGLSYQNSRDVQIEIKISRKGYIDQTKRFNVRQAIDQQEISSFYDLIKKEED